MRATSLEEIRLAVHGRWLTAPAAVPVNIERVSTDSRAAGAGDLFVAIRGDRFDGHDFLGAAAAAGCSAAVIERDRPVPGELGERYRGGLIGVADTTVALGELAAFHRSRLTAEVIAVTGSVGKTTVKRMIHHILGARLRGQAAPKSFNNAIGVPLTVLSAGSGDDYLVCELGANAPGEIAALTRIAQPTVAVITAVGPSHLAKLGSIARVAIEKASVLGGLRRRGVAVAWADCQELRNALRAYDARIIRFGESDDAELRLTAREGGGLRQRFQLNGRMWVDLPMPGRHNAVNALAALAVAMRFGIEVEVAAAALSSFEGPEMRMQARRIGPVTLINDAYNANPMSMAAALEVLADLPAERKVFVAGDMLELGDTAEAYHLDLGRRAAKAGVGLLVGVGALGGLIVRGAAEAGVDGIETRLYKTAASAAPRVAAMLAPGDAVLVKASRAVGAERIVRRIAAAAEGMS